MRKSNLGYIFGGLMLSLLFAACSNQPADTVLRGGTVEDYVSFVDSLRARGITAEAIGTVEQPFFSPEGNLIKANDQEIQVFEFSSAAEANTVAENISEDGSSVGTSMMMWIGAPHFYKADKIIVLYIGEKEEITSLLEEALGPQIAGR